MKRPLYIVRRKDGLYFFRCSIPTDIRSIFKEKKEFRISLHTFDLEKAQLLAERMHLSAQRLFQKMRQGKFMTDDLEFLKKQIKIGIERKDRPGSSCQNSKEHVVMFDYRTEVTENPEQASLIKKTLEQVDADWLERFARKMNFPGPNKINPGSRVQDQFCKFWIESVGIDSLTDRLIELTLLNFLETAPLEEIEEFFCLIEVDYAFLKKWEANSLQERLELIIDAADRSQPLDLLEEAFPLFERYFPYEFLEENKPEMNLAGFLGREKKPEQRSTKSQDQTTFPLVSEVYPKFRQEQLKAKTWTEKTAAEYDACISQFEEMMGDLPLDQVSKEVARKYKEKLIQLPVNRKKDKRYRDLRIEEVLRMPIKKTISTTTVNKNLKDMGVLFNWCSRNYENIQNPFEGLQLTKSGKASEERDPFSEEDLKRIFNPKTYLKEAADRPERFWVPLMALYTGARLDELCQLHITDLREEEGEWILDINANKDQSGYPKKLKNKSSERIVPVHPKLIELGLIEYRQLMIQKKWPRLFPGLGYSHTQGFSRQLGWWFNVKYLRKVLGIKIPKKTFHSFRHTVGNQLKQKGVAESFIGELLGHSSKSVTMGRYGKSYQPRVLLEEAVMKLEFDLDFEGLMKKEAP